MNRFTLVTLLLIYGLASVIHFIHNAEFLSDYPGLPDTWVRSDIYAAWLVITLIGIGGWVLLVRGLPRAGLMLLTVYAVLGMDSLGHYGVASFSEHTFAMNATILFEVFAASFLFLEAMRQMVLVIHAGRRKKHAANQK